MDDGLFPRTKNLWGQHFYWLCDCAAIKEILEYSDSIYIICRWAQELLGYQFNVIHRSIKMMGDVDALSRKYGLIICSHLQITHILKSGDEKSRPAAYFSHSLHTFTSTRKQMIDCQPQHIPVSISAFLSDTTAKPIIAMAPLPQTTTTVSLSSDPIILTSVNTSCTNDSHFIINNSAWFQDTLLHSSLW